MHFKNSRANKKSKSDKTYHLVYLFRWKIRKHTLYEIEDKFCSALGYENHQRISAIHKDTDNLHIHMRSIN
ncbi:relaxase/mobilization nuclease domain-containing protein [Bartonella raoultii]|uniref:relaxase/mobilization nuclease domain-containing protein n=1 Tax=Bartonella raoultii TaxID=1457020 RepID=UPI0035315173